MKETQKSGKADMMQQMLRQMRATYLDELPERLDKLDNLLLSIERRGAATEDEFNEFYRGIHSIKGSGGTYGLHILSTICHQLEDRLRLMSDNLTKLPHGFVDGALAYTGLLRAVVGEAKNGNEAFPEIEKKLLDLNRKTATVKHSVLLVEPSRLNAKIYMQALSDLPVCIVVVEDGCFALLRVLNEHFDVLITSQEVPVLNGRAIIGALRLSDSPSCGIKTILLTANAGAKYKINRAIDASYVIIKDHSCAQNLRHTVVTILEGLNKKVSAKQG